LEQVYLGTALGILLTLFLGNQVMASTITLVNKNNNAQSLKFHLYGLAQNRINVANVLNGFKASAVFMEDNTMMEADDNGLSVDTFTTGSTYTITIIPIHGRSSFCILLVAKVLC
jgi:hypothetical protein